MTREGEKIPVSLRETECCYPRAHGITTRSLLTEDFPVLHTELPAQEHPALSLALFQVSLPQATWHSPQETCS